jgi:Thermolysin metallopeptidase, catalytic domain/Thermolysin metallopeptidase, alpha-helical domain
VRKNSLAPLGNTSTLRILRDTQTSDVSEVLLHFPSLESVAPAGSAIQSAELELHLASAQLFPRFVLGYAGAAAPWSEGSVMWNSRPASVGKYGEVSYYVKAGTVGVVRMDVTALVRLWATGKIKERTLVLRPGSADMDVSFHSRETLKIEDRPSLVVRCNPIQKAVPADSALMDARQMAAFKKLKADSALTPWIQVDQGGVRIARLDLPIPPAAGATGSERARWFVSTYADALRLRDPATQMQLARRSRDGQHIFFRQLHEGIPVIPAELGVHMQDGRIVIVGGGYVPDITADPTPKLTAAEAEKIVLGLVPEGVDRPPQLRFLNTGLTGGPDKETYLTWLVPIRQGTGYFVDASSGRVRQVRPAALFDFGLDLEDANAADYSLNCADWDTTFVDDQACTEDGCHDWGWADPEIAAAWFNIRDIYTWWYYSPLGRDSYDDDGSEIEMYVHVTDNGSKWNQAHYLPYGECFEFGEGWAFSQDVVGHEFAHAVTEHTMDMDCCNEPGALKESFSDVFGEMTEGDHPDWIVGTSNPNGGQRNLRRPFEYYHPEVYGGEYWVFPPSDPNDDNDRGGSHTNRSVTNRAAYLLIAGHGPLAPDPDPVLGIGAVKGFLLLQSVQFFLPSNANMIDLRNHAVMWAEIYHAAGVPVHGVVFTA